MKAVYSLTFRTLTRSLKTYIFLAVMFLAEGLFMTYVNFNNGYSAIEYSLEFIEIVLITVLPLICAEAFAADRESGFEKMLFTIGVSSSRMFFGKALAILTVFAIPCLLLPAAPLFLTAFGRVNLLAAFTSVLAYCLTGIALVFLCLFISLTVRRRLYAYIISYTALLLAYVFCIFSGTVPVTRNFSLLILTLVLITVSVFIYVFTRSVLVFGGVFCVTEACLIFFYFVTPRLFAEAFSALLELLSPCLSLNTVIYGTFDITAIVHLVLFTAVFAVLSVMQLGRRKYE